MSQGSLGSLATLTGEQIAYLAARAVYQHVALVAPQLPKLVVFPSTPAAADYVNSPLGQVIASLVSYAQIGWESALSAEEARALLEEVLPVFYGSPAGDRPEVKLSGWTQGDRRSPWGLVFSACVGRLRLHDNYPLHLTLMAALSGLDMDSVRTSVRMAELPCTGLQVPSHAARDWLRERGVRGL